MTHHDVPDRDLVAWFADDATRRAPVQLLDAVVADTTGRSQQPGWLVALRGDALGTRSVGSRSARQLVVLVVLTALVVVAAALIAGQPKHKAGPLAYISNGDVYLANADGSGARLLLREDGVAFTTVAWSSTGLLALDGDAGAAILDVATGRTSVVGGHAPVWSPDGKRLAVLDPDGRGIRFVDAATQATVAAYPFTALGGLSWSPNGRWIAATGGEGSKSVVRIDVTTGEEIQIEGPSGHLDSAKDVTWSPDSLHLAFIRYQQGQPARGVCGDSLECRVDVIVAEADGSNAHVLNRQPGFADEPSWSPDGQWIAFRDVSGNALGPVGLRIARADGTEERALVAGNVGGFAWGPNSDRLLYTIADVPSPQARVWEATLSGEVRSLGVLIDGGFAPSLALAWRATDREITASFPSVAPYAAATPAIATPVPAPPADPSASWSAILTDQAFGCQPTSISTTTWLPTSIATLCDPALESWDISGGGWSPTGSAYAFSYGASEAPQKLVIARRDGSIALERTLPAASNAGGWAPDGSRLGFIVGGDVWIVARDPEDAWSIADVPVGDATNMTWSPDSRSLAVLRSDGNLQIGLPDGTELRAMGVLPLPVAWAPNSWPFAFVRDGDVWLKGGNGVAPRNLSQLRLGGATGAAWSPDGTQIVVVTGSGLLLMAPDGGHPRWIDLGVEHTGGASWSPDSARFALEVEGSSNDLLIVSADGSASVRVHGVDGPTWSPDGRFLLVMDSHTGNLAILNADGSGRRDLSTPDVVSGSAAWVR